MSSARWMVGSVFDLVKRINAKQDDEVWMRNVELSDRNAAFVANSLIDSKSICELWLSYCGITDMGACEFAGVLSDCDCSIKFLNLSGNDIGDDGVIALSAALEKNTSLQSLFLNENRISDDGAAAIANAIKKNKTLIELYLWDNQLTDKGAEDISRALLLNKSMTKCELDNGDEDETNKINDREIVHSVRVYCERNAANSTVKLMDRNPSSFRRTAGQMHDFDKV